MKYFALLRITLPPYVNFICTYVVVVDVVVVSSPRNCEHDVLVFLADAVKVLRHTHGI